MSQIINKLKGGLRPPIVSLAQTDGSYWISNKIGRTAVILRQRPEMETWRFLNTYMQMRNSTEAEWRSILDGVDYAQSKGIGTLDVENDNLGVCQSLMKRQLPQKGWEREYYYEINTLVKQMDYCSIRWIPRAQNKADKLFR
jgi:ribonuclease HI